MCLIAVAWKTHPDYPLVVCANRDEFLARPTQIAHFWPDFPQIFGGRDSLGGGSWMGVSTQGRFAAVTNIRNPAANRDDVQSRGLLVSQFLENNTGAEEYCTILQQQSQLYNGYNFIAFDGVDLVYQSNYLDQPQILPPGFYGVSNATLDHSWPKTRSAVSKLKNWLGGTGSVNQLATLLNDHTSAPDDQLPQTGVTLELEQALSAEFIVLPEYGTRSSTGFILHRSGRAEYCEVTHEGEGLCSQQEFDSFL